MKKSNLLEGTIIATAAIVITKILGMLYVIPFYAVVGVRGSALYAYAYNIYVIFLDISTAGIPSAMSKITKEYNTLGKMDAKKRAYSISKRIIGLLAISMFIIMFAFAPLFAKLILGDLTGGNTIKEVTMVIRAISLAILVIPFLSVSKGYLQGHSVIGVSSMSQVIEQVVRIAVILIGSYITLRIFNMPLDEAVSISVTGAFFGGLLAYLYVRIKMKKNKKELSLESVEEKDDITDKEITKKIMYYASSFIITSIAVSIYSFVDMVFISRTLTSMGYIAAETEFVTAAVTTWAPKIGMIINSIAMGLAVSLVPSIVEANTLKKWKDVESHINKGLQIVLSICLPLIVIIALLSKGVWSVFYGSESLNLGTLILAIYIIEPLFFNIYLVSSTAMQSLNKFKIVYISTFLGYLINALLDVPLMYLFKVLGLHPFIGAIVASIIGYSLSFLIAFIHLRKKHDIKFTESFKTLKNSVVPTIAVAIEIMVLKLLVPVNYDSKMSCIIYIGVIGLISSITYLFIAYKIGLLDEVFGREYLDKIIRKITFGKIKINTNK